MENIFAVKCYKKGETEGVKTEAVLTCRTGGQTQGTASKEKPTRRKALGGVQIKVGYPLVRKRGS